MSRIVRPAIARRTISVAALALVALLVWPAAPTAKSAEWDNEDMNVRLEIPDSPYPWAWSRAKPNWAKAGIVRGAERVLEKLKTGEKAEKEMGIVHLIVRDAPEDTELKALAEDSKTRKLLLSGFGSESEWPDVEVDDEYTLPKDHPAIHMEAEGEALNFANGKKGRCTARMVVSMARGKAYFLCLWAWHTEYDDEGLLLDLTMIEDGFEILNTKEDKPAEPPPEQPAEDEGPAEEERVEEKIDLREYQLRMTKHKQLTRVDPEGVEDLILKFEGSARNGSYYSIYIYAQKNGRIIDGQQMPAQNIKKWITTDWWKNFRANHPEGEYHTFKWPKAKEPTFITLPELDNERARKHIAGGNKKIPVDPSAGDMQKRLKCVESVKKPKTVGKRYKVIEPWRGILQAPRPRTAGRETVVRFAWRTVNHSYRVFVTLGGEAYQGWGPALRETIESIAFYKD